MRRVQGSPESKNLFYRPADLRASLSSVATATLKVARQNKSAPKATTVKGNARRSYYRNPRPKVMESERDNRKLTRITFRKATSLLFICLIKVAYGNSMVSSMVHRRARAELEDPQSNRADDVRPALSGKTAAYSAADDIRFNLFAPVKDNHQLFARTR